MDREKVPNGSYSIESEDGGKEIAKNFLLQYFDIPDRKTNNKLVFSYFINVETIIIQIFNQVFQTIFVILL